MPVLDRTVLVLERGDQTSALGRIQDGCLAEAPADLALGRDQNLLLGGGRAFVGVNDDGSLREIDAATLAFRKTIDVYADHPKPMTTHGIYGVDAAGGDLWVSRDDVGSLAVVSPGGKITPVDLGDLDPDGVPEMNGILVEGGHAYVALDFLTTPFPTGPDGPPADQAKQAGAIAVIDTTTHARVGLLDLVGHNPAHAPVPLDGTGNVVAIATPGTHDEVRAEDGIDRVWLDGSRPAEQLIGEPELGGSVDEVVAGGEDELYAIVLGPEAGINPTQVVAIDPSKAAGPRVTVLMKAPYFDDPVNGAAYVHTGLALTKDHLLVGDHTPGRSGIHVLSRATGREVAFLPTKAAPWALVALPP